jgi:hypothetical protein
MLRCPAWQLMMQPGPLLRLWAQGWRRRAIAGVRVGVGAPQVRYRPGEGFVNEAGPETRGAKSRTVSWLCRSWIERATTGTEKRNGPAAAVPMSRAMWAAVGVRDLQVGGRSRALGARGPPCGRQVKGNPCCLTWQELLSCEHLAIPAAGIQHLY